MPTPSAPSRRPATSSIRRLQSASTTTSIPPAARAIRRMPMSRFVGASPSPTRCCAAAGCWKRRGPPEVGLRLHFTLPLKTPVKSKQLTLDVFDPTFFIDFTFTDKDPVRLVGAPAACAMQFQRPNDGAATARKLGEQTFAGGENSNY